jgi:copper(I)-binding protein
VSRAVDRRRVLAALAAFPLAACAGAGIEVREAWARPAPAGALTAVYLTIRNGGPPDRLLRLEGDVARSIELHRSVSENGVVQMRPAEAIELPRGELVFAAQGYHVMLIGLTRELRAGERFPLTLRFERAAPLPATVQVRM